MGWDGRRVKGSFGIADRDDGVEARGCAVGPLRCWACAGGLEERDDRGGGVVVAWSWLGSGWRMDKT